MEFKEGYHKKGGVNTNTKTPRPEAPKPQGEKENMSTEEICPYCDCIVELPPYLGIYKCPQCGELIISCSLCEKLDCNDCEFSKATQALQNIKECTRIIVE